MRQWIGRRTRIVACAMMAALVSGCGGATSDGACRAFARPVPYDAAAQLRALADLDGLPAASPVHRMIEELASYRARWRAVCA